MDDDSKSIPETLQLLQSKLQTLQNNQSEVQLSLGALNKAVTGLQERLDRVNTSLQREGLTQGGDGQVKQSLADLGVRVSEIRQGLELASNTSSKNSASISMITTELNSIKVRTIDKNMPQNYLISGKFSDDASTPFCEFKTSGLWCSKIVSMVLLSFRPIFLLAVLIKCTL